MTRLQSDSESQPVTVEMESWSDPDIGKPGARVEVSVELEGAEVDEALEAAFADEVETGEDAREAVLRALGLLE